MIVSRTSFPDLMLSWTFLHLCPRAQDGGQRYERPDGPGRTVRLDRLRRRVTGDTAAQLCSTFLLRCSDVARVSFFGRRRPRS